MAVACEHSAQSWSLNKATNRMYCDDCESVIVQAGGMWVTVDPPSRRETRPSTPIALNAWQRLKDDSE